MSLSPERSTGARSRWQVAAWEGAVWAINDLDHGHVLRIDPLTNRIVARVRASAQVLAAGDGGIWALTSSQAGGSRLRRVDPVTNDIFARVPDVGYGWPASGEGAVWMGRCSYPRPCIEVFRVDASTNSMEEEPIVVEPGPSKPFRIGLGGPVITVGVGEGALWVGSDVSHEVIRVPL
jgi:hypothetical protein